MIGGNAPSPCRLHLLAGQYEIAAPSQAGTGVGGRRPAQQATLLGCSSKWTSAEVILSPRL